MYKVWGFQKEGSLFGAPCNFFLVHSGHFRSIWAPPSLGNPSTSEILHFMALGYEYLGSKGKFQATGHTFGVVAC